MPRTRIPAFEKRLGQLCEEAGLPPHDEVKYHVLRDTALFLWHDPEFCLAAPLASASPFGLTADMLRGAWDQKFGSAATPAR